MSRKRTHVPAWHVRKQSFQLLIRGEKRVFLVPAWPHFDRLRVGELVRIMNGSVSILRRIAAIRRYPTVFAAIDGEDLSHVCHGDAVQTAGYLERIYHPMDLELEGMSIELVVPTPLESAP